MTDPPRIQTPRLLLRPFERTDVADVFEYSVNPEFARYLPSIRLPYEYQQAVEFVEQAMAADPSARPVWAMVVEGRVMGSINAQFDRYAHMRKSAMGSRASSGAKALRPRPRRRWSTGYSSGSAWSE